MALYETNLATVTLCQDATGFTELAAPHSSGSTPASSTENFIQDGNSVDQATGQGDNQDSGMEFIGSSLTWTGSSNWVFLGWVIYASPTNLKSWANGGFRVGVSSSADNTALYNAMGNDFGRYPYGGWQSIAIDPEFAGGSDQDIGTPTTPYVGLAFLPNVTVKITKGSPIAVDAWRYGRGDIEVTSTGCTFTGMAAANDASTAKWGLFQDIGGIYLWKGLMSLGLSGTTVTFSDSDKVIRVDDTPRVVAGFNAIEIHHASSSVTWDAITFIGVGTSITGSAPVSPGIFEMIDNATVVKTGCSFSDMGTFIYQSNADISSTKYIRCDLVTTGGAPFAGCTFSDTNDAAKAVLCASPAEAALLTDCIFNSGGTGHAIEIGGTAANVTLSGNIFTGYDTADPGTAANKAIFVNIATGTMTITISGGSGVTEDYHVRSAGATVTVNSDTTVTFTGMKDNTEVRIYKVSDDSVVAGIEDATDGTTNNRSFAWAAPAATEVYYRLHNFQDGVPMYETIEVPKTNPYTVPSNDTSIPISQRLDRNVA